MHKTITNIESINKELRLKIKENSLPTIVAVSKTFPISDILPLIEYGHIDFGENKIQEAVSKWTDIKLKFPNIKLHLVGKLQTNKVKLAIGLFDYIHSLDNEKLAKKISDEQIKQNIKPKLFIQVNIGNETQKNGIQIEKLDEFYNYCKKLDLNVVGLMCIPPLNDDPEISFLRMNYLKKKMNFKELSMGMSSDYLDAIKYNSTFLRIGSAIFGQRN